MQRSVPIASTLGRASVLLLVVATALAAQSASTQTTEGLAQMRADLAAGRYAAVIAEANGLLESARAITRPQRMELWQLLAAAYYPEATDAQQPDSARLPLAALIRLEPDITIARELSWPGLDELTERTRAASFVVATRPLAAYTLSRETSAQLAVVASRPTRFRLTSVDDATGRTVIHDSAAFVTSAELKLRTHDADGPVFTDGVHRLDVWAYDRITGDSLRITHRVRAERSDLPASVADAASLSDGAPPAEIVELPPELLVPTRVATPNRSVMLWGGLVFAAATAIIAQEARPHDTVRSGFRVDGRAFIVGAVMAGAAVLNFFTRRSAPPPAPSTMMSPEPPPVLPVPDPVETYQVRLQIIPPER